MNNSLEEDISQRILELMNTKKLKKHQLAELLGISQQSVQSLLTNRSNWRISMLLKCAIFFRIPLENLIFDNNEYINNIIKQADEHIKSNKSIDIENNPELWFQLVKSIRLKTTIYREDEYLLVAEPKAEYKAKK